MARKPNHQFEKRKREQAREERSAARRERRQQRIAASSSPDRSGEDPDLAGIVVGPQARDRIPDEVAKRAVARAMNPGKPMPGDEPLPERSARLFVGNVDFGVEEVELRDFFESAGFKATEVTVVKDRDTGQPRGFAFVEISGAGQAARAVAELNGVEFAGRDLRLNLADSPRGRR